MPLKPILEKTPLTTMGCQSLRAGMARIENEKTAQLYAIVAKEANPAALEGAYRLACLVTARPDQEPVAERIRAALAAQKEDGSFGGTVMDAVAVLRAGWAMYEYEVSKALLEPVSRWCGWLVKNWDKAMAEDALWANPADLLELLLNLYRVSGKASVLALCERVSTQTMQWSSVLNTVSAQRPTCRTITQEELATCLSIEKDSRDGYYTQFCRTNHPQMLADGARASMARGWLTGSATELAAAKNGWERLSRHHGAVCGGLTSDELLEGASPAMPVSTAALGAWAEALCAAGMGQKAEWAWNAVERMIFNAMPAVVKEGRVLPFQRVNTLEKVQEKDCFHVHDDHEVRSLCRLARGWAAVASSTVTVQQDGFSVNLYMPGKYAVALEDARMALAIGGTRGKVAIQVHCPENVKAVACLRMPAWARTADVSVNGIESDAGKDCRDGYMTIERTWHDGDVITISLEQTLRLVEGHHQGRCVMAGPVLMALDAASGEDWARSLAGCTAEDGKVVALVDDAKEWKLRSHVPADIPVLPAASGAEVKKVALVAYAEAAAPIAFFPWRKNA